VKCSLMTLLFLALFGVSSASLAIDANQKKCFGKMHACFKGNTDLVIDLNPTALYQCEDACDTLADINAPTEGGNCSVDQCVLRCAVAFGLAT